MPTRAKVLAAAVFLALLAVVIGAVELVSPGSGWRHLKFWGVSIAAVYWPLAFGVMRRVYGQHRMDADRRERARNEAKYRRWFFAYFMPPMALLFAIFGAVDTGPAWDAMHGRGRPGWATLERQECTRTCSWKGTFRSDDGAVVRVDVWIREPPQDAHAHDRIRAIDTDDRATVFDAAGEGARTHWSLSAALFVVSALYLVCWLAWVVWTTGLWSRLRHDGEDLLLQLKTGRGGS